MRIAVVEEPVVRPAVRGSRPTLRVLVLGFWFLVLALALAGCGGSDYTQSAQTDSYQVQLGLDGTNFDEHTATIEVRDKSNQPVDGAEVVVASLMQAMGMVSPEQTAQPQGSGRYLVKGAFFSMIGEWEFDVRISAGGKEEIARFKVPVQE
jgi:hypothetical protein